MTRIRFDGCDLSLAARHPGAGTLTAQMETARDLVEVEVPPPAERPRGDDSPVLRVPPARLVAREGRPPPVVRDAEELAGQLPAHVSSVPMHRLPPALAAAATPRILALLGDGPGWCSSSASQGSTRGRSSS